MNGRELAAGWPFAGLLALDLDRAEVSGAVPVHGLTVGIDNQAGILVSDEITGPLTTDMVTGFHGVDGYLIGRGNIHIGDSWMRFRRSAERRGSRRRSASCGSRRAQAPARPSRAPQSPLRARERLTHRVTQAQKG